MIYLMQEVTLVFVTVDSLTQESGITRCIGLHVMSRCNQVGAQLRGVIKKSTELNFPVAQNVRIGRSACTIFR